MSNTTDRKLLERKLERLKRERAKYGQMAMNAMSVDRFNRAERLFEIANERIWSIEEQLER